MEKTVAEEQQTRCFVEHTLQQCGRQMQYEEESVKNVVWLKCKLTCYCFCC